MVCNGSQSIVQLNQRHEEVPLHLAESKLLAGVASSDESGEETVGHVAPPLGETLGFDMNINAEAGTV